MSGICIIICGNSTRRRCRQTESCTRYARSVFLVAITTSAAPSIMNGAITYSPYVASPVASFTTPIRYGLRKPARLPIELIAAIPAAADFQFSAAVGRVQSSGMLDRLPAIAALIAARPITR